MLDLLEARNPSDLARRMDELATLRFGLVGAVTALDEPGRVPAGWTTLNEGGTDSLLGGPRMARLGQLERAFPLFGDRAPDKPELDVTATTSAPSAFTNRRVSPALFKCPSYGPVTSNPSPPRGLAARRRNAHRSGTTNTLPPAGTTVPPANANRTPPSTRQPLISTALTPGFLNSIYSSS